MIFRIFSFDDLKRLAEIYMLVIFANLFKSPKISKNKILKIIIITVNPGQDNFRYFIFSKA